MCATRRLADRFVWDAPTASVGYTKHVSQFLEQIDAFADKHASLVIAGGVGLFATGAALIGLGWSGALVLPFTTVKLGLVLAPAGMFAVFVGMRSATSTTYPTPEESFPSLPLDEFKAALFAEYRPLCVCADCLIHLPAQFSTGSCPRCLSSVRYYEINTDEDVDMVLLDLPGAPSESAHVP